MLKPAGAASLGWKAQRPRQPKDNVIIADRSGRSSALWILFGDGEVRYRFELGNCDTGKQAGTSPRPRVALFVLRERTFAVT